MSQVLTMDEIRARYRDEWVLIADPQTGAELNVLGGTVLYHHPDRDTFDRESLALHPKRFTVLCLREAEAGMKYVLWPDARAQQPVC